MAFVQNLAGGLPISRSDHQVKKLTAKDPTLLADLDSVISPVTRGHPESALLWTAKAPQNCPPSFRPWVIRSASQPTPAQAKLLPGAIIAVTLQLTSPTTTAVDRQQTAALARLAKVKLTDFGREVLVRNDETLDRPAAELVKKDLKEFSGNGVRFAVTQIETVDRSRLDGARLKKLASALSARCQRSGWKFAALLVTDIFRSDSLVLLDVKSAAVARKLGPGG